VEILSEDAEALGCVAELGRLPDLARHGTSSDRQRAVRAAAMGAGATEAEAMKAVVDHLIEEFHADL
jgi:carboxylate-amine ligase